MQSELTYYEYWLSMETWPAWRAIALLAYFIKLKRSWAAYEVYEETSDTLYNEIANRLNRAEGREVFTNYAIAEEMDEFRNWIPKGIDMDKSEVDPARFIKWAHACGYPLPWEFKEFVGIEDKDSYEGQMTQRRETAIDKAICQAVARTLWDEKPDMTTEDMIFHKAIQVYGGGKGYSTDTTLRVWLREMDQRTTGKRGPKKKSQ